MLIYPLIVVEGGGATVDTRVEIVNLTARPIDLKCIYVPAQTCSGLDFHVRLTPNQPLSWLASRGLFSGFSSTAVPPFSADRRAQVHRRARAGRASTFHNAIQGRAAVFGADGQTIGYSAVGFLRLSDGPLERHHPARRRDLFAVPGRAALRLPPSDRHIRRARARSSLAPCTEDLENLGRRPTTTVQFLVVNEFEQHLSASTIVTCYARRTLRQISQSFTRATLGSETGHLIVRGVQSPVLAMLVDHFQTPGGAPARPATSRRCAAVARRRSVFP